MEVVRALAVVLLVPLLSQCVTAKPSGNVSPPRIALVGDSWPLLMRHHQGFKRALVQEGYQPRQVRNVAIGWSFIRFLEPRLAYAGVESYHYMEKPFLHTLDRTLKRYPTIEVIHLSLGGADVLHDMPAGLDASAQERFVRKKILPHIDALLSYLEERYPDKHIAFVGYDYLNFRDTRATSKRTEDHYERLGQPEPFELNEFSRLINRMQREVVRGHPRVKFIDYLGHTKQLVGAAQDDSEPNPHEMLWRDGMHLSRTGNTALARFCLDTTYWEWLTPLRDARGRLIIPISSRVHVPGAPLRTAGKPH